MIRSATTEDAVRICEIYNHYVLNSTITFEEQVVAVDEMKERITETLAGLPWLVWIEGEIIEGFAYASKWKGRCAYRYSVESTIYLAEGSTSRGIGTKLCEALLEELRLRKLHTVMGGIALPNPASVALHQKLGFESCRIDIGDDSPSGPIRPEGWPPVFAKAIIENSAGRTTEIINYRLGPYPHSSKPNRGSAEPTYNPPSEIPKVVRWPDEIKQ